jgi:hypothetical protein
MPSSIPSIKLGSFRKSRLRLALALSLFQPKPWASAILVDEHDPLVKSAPGNSFGASCDEQALSESRRVIRRP